jgi:hypothetical protein
MLGKGVHAKELKVLLLELPQSAAIVPGTDGKLSLD